jgi:uncharacterized protein (DUF433 family)
MSRKHITRFSGDVREHPRYSIEEAAGYLRIPHTTLLAWTRGQNYMTRDGRRKVFHPVIELADSEHKLLSFYNLVEAHVLRATTERGVPLRNVRKAIEFLRESWLIPSAHPLLVHEFETSGKELFIKHLGHTVNATAHGQYAMRQILKKYLKKIRRDKLGMPTEITPIHAHRLAIDIGVSSGKPVVRGTGIVASVLRDRKEAGESIPELARDYGLTPIEVRQAIQELAAA